MVKWSSVSFRQVLRYVLFLLLGLFVVTLGFIYAYPAFIMPAISSPLWSVHLLVVMVYGVPLGLVIVYLALRLVLPTGTKMPLRGFRQWIVAYVLVLGYGLTWVFLAFLFETFTPFLPITIGGAILPIYIILMIMIILTRTRMRSKVEQLLKSLFKEDSN